MADRESYEQAVDTYLNQQPAPQPLTADDAVGMYLGDEDAPKAQPNIQASLSTAVDVNPDAQAEARRIAKNTGLPLETVLGQPDQAKKQETLGAIDYESYKKLFPLTAEVLADPEVAKIAHDDMDNMGQIENTLSNAFKQGYAEPSQNIGTTLEVLGFESTADFFNSVETPQNYQSASQAFMSPPENEFSVGGFAPQYLPRATVEQSGQILGSIASRVLGIGAGAAVGAGAGSLVPGLGTAAGAVGGGAAGAFVGPFVFEAAQIVGPVAKERAKRNGYEKPTKEDLAYAWTTAAASGSLNALGTKYLPGGDKAVGEFTQKIVKAFFGEGVTEGTQSVVQQVGESVETVPGLEVSGKQAVGEAILGGTAGSSVTAAEQAVAKGAQRVTQQFKKAQGAEQDAQAAQALNDVVAQSKLRLRDPEAFKQYIDKLTADGAKDIYLDPNALQQSGVDLIALAGQSPSVAEQLQTALDTGGAIKIPMSEFATNIAGTDLGTALVDHVKTDPNGMSRAESQVFYQEQAELIREEAAKITEEKANDEVWQQSLAEVKADIDNQQKAAGRFTDSVNDVNTSLYLAGVQTYASKMNMPPMEWHKKYGLGVTAQMMTDSGTELEQFDQAGQRKIDTPEFKNWFGDSKVVDAEGKPLVVYHGSPDARFMQDDATFKHRWTGETKGAHWFASSRRTAATYADDRRAFDYQRAEPGVISAYLSMKNPLIVDGAGKNWREAQQRGKTSDVIEEAQKNGHDGVIIKNVRDDYNNDTKNQPTDTYVVFDSTQIKSVNNQGTFDPNNPNILMQSDKFSVGQMTNVGKVEDVTDEQVKANGKWYVKKIVSPTTEPELTAEQKAENFKRWSRGYDVVRIGDSHEFESEVGIVVEAMHGTTGDFTTFNRQKANPESDMGAGFYFTNSLEDVGNNYAGLGPDLTQKVQLLAERIASETDKEYDDPEVVAQARSEFMANEGLTMPVYVRFDNPAVLGGNYETTFTYEESYDEETDEYGEPTGTLIDFVEGLRSAAAEYNDGDVEEAIDKMFEEAVDGELSLSRVEAILKESEQFSYFTNDEGQLVSNEIKRQALENAGFDGVIDQTVNDKFGSNRQSGQSMVGMDYDTVHFIAFKPEQIKSSLGNQGTYDESSNILYQSEQAPQFYSALERTVSELPQGKGSAQQWQGIIKNLTQKGVKQEEIDFLGIQDWLGQQEGTVTKEQVIEFIKANQLRVEEVVKGTEYVQDSTNYYIQEDPDGGYQLFDGDRGVAIENFDTEEEANRALTVYNEGTEVRDTTKFKKYTLPGGENYRELLITLPQRDGELRSEWTVKQISRSEFTIENRNGDEDGMSYDTREEATAAANKRNSVPVTNYRSSHYDEKNILSHIRFNERTDADGKRVMFIEEIQSDWHQEGRKKGYKSDTSKLKIREISKDDPLYKEKYKYGLAKENFKAYEITTPEGEKAYYADVSEAAVRQRYSDVKQSSAVPDAPFKTTWAELAFKRALMWAVENNFDRVAWTTGEQQAERYDLSKQVSTVTYRPELKRLVAYDLNEKKVIEETVEPENIEDYVGKDVAKKLLETPVDSFGEHQLSGENLKVGGEGMKTFYDKMLPSMVNKLVKKFGGKVGVTAIETGGGKPTSYADFDAWKKAKDGQSSAVHSLDITPAMRDAISQGLPLFQGQRGSYNPATRIMTLLNRADLSTFTHELGHYFLEINTQIASQPDAPELIKEDTDKLLKWFGIQGESREVRLAKWQSMSLDEQRPHHEKLATSFERYVMEGKAPSLALKETFQRLRSWMLSVYRSIRDFLAQNPQAGELTDEVRSVFDRMLATEEQIKEAKAARNFDLMFKSAEEAGMTPEQFAEYQATNVQADEDAVATLEKRSMRDLTWTRKLLEKTVKRFNKDAAEKRKTAKEQVTKEVRQEPTYKAMHWLKYGEMVNDDGEEIKAEAGYKLDRKAVEELFPEQMTNRPDLNKLGKGKYGMAGKDGLHPDLVAEMFGFQSGESLVRTLIDAEPEADVIEARTDQRMLEKYGDLTSEDAVKKAADEAIHNEVRIRLAATEMAVLLNQLGGVRDLEKLAKSSAIGAINEVKVKDLNPNRYASAAAKATRNADKAFKSGARDEALKFKRQHVFNLAMTKEAVQAQEEIDSALTKFKRLFRSDDRMRKTYDMRLITAARAVLGAYGIGGKVRAQDAVDALEKVKEYSPELYAELEPLVRTAIFNANNYRELSLGDFRAMTDSVTQIVHQAKRFRQIRVDGELRSKKEVVAELTARMDEIGVPDKAVGDTEAVTDADRRKWTLKGLVAAVRRVESWVDSMDGVNVRGPFRKYIWEPMNEAITNYRTAKNVYLKKYIELLRAKEKEFSPGKIQAPELNYTFGSKYELLGALLHIGNESNKRKLLVGRGWGELKTAATGEKLLDTSKMDAFLNRLIAEGKLTKSDFDFLQSVWDLMEELKPDAQKAHFEIKGVYFNEITADEIKTPFGTYRGGYAPAVADGEIVLDKALKNEAQAIEEGFGFMMPSTPTGFTKARADNYNKPLTMDLRLVASHIDQVLRFTHIQPVVMDSLRIMRDRSFGDKLNRIDNQAIKELLMPWLHRSARQLATTPFQGTAGRAVSKFLRTARTRTGMVTMMANFVNAFQQVTGFTMAAVKVKPRYLKASLLRYMKNPSGTSETLKGLSPWMAERLDAEIFELQNALDNMLEPPSKLQQAREWSSRNAYFAQRAFQNLVDITTWQAAYDQASAEGMTEKEAVRFADSVVRQTQGSQKPEDMARFEASNAFLQLFTQFTGYFNMQGNLLGTEFKKAVKDMGADKKRMTYVYLMGFMLPAVLADAIVRSFGWDWDDEDDDGYLDEFFAWFFGSQARTAAAMVPFAGSVANAAVSTFNNKPFDDRISTSPTLSVAESAYRAPKSIYNAAAGEGKTSKAIGDTLSLLTLTTGLPFTAVSRPAKYIADVAEDEVEPANMPDFIRGAVSGRGREEERQ